MYHDPRQMDLIDVTKARPNEAAEAA